MVPTNSCDCRWSSLPEPHLHHILSFLTTREMVKTSFISRQWRNAWTHVLVRNFDEEFLHSEQAFVRFVHGVFARHQTARLQKFRLSLYWVVYDSLLFHLITLWVKYAAEHFASELILCLPDLPVTALDSIYASKWLKRLSLDLSGYECSPLFLGSYVYFPRLVALDLHRSDIYFAPPNSIQNLINDCPNLISCSIKDCSLGLWGILDFSGCMNLESLSINGCKLLGLEAVNISAPELRRLSLNVRWDRREGEIKISALKLQHFNYRGQFIEKLPSLMDADIDCWVHENVKGLLDYSSAEDDYSQDDEEDQEDGSDEGGERKFGFNRAVDGVLNLLKALKNAEKLSLSETSIEVISSAIHSTCLPLSTNVTHLTLEICNICVGNQSKQGFPEDCWEVEEFPLDHLKEVEIRGFGGRSDIELNFAKFFLKNAKVLERLHIPLCGLSASERRILNTSYVRLSVLH